MAFFRKASNILKQTVSRHINSEVCGSGPSFFQTIRCMSSSKLFVGGISYNLDETALTESFSKYGQVIEARIIRDRETGRSKGFGFVTFTNTEEASAAVQALDGQDLHGRRIGVNYANDRAPRGGGYDSGYGGGSAGSYGGGGGGYRDGGYNSGGGGYNSGGGGYNSNFSGFGDNSAGGDLGGGLGDEGRNLSQGGGVYQTETAQNTGLNSSIPFDDNNLAAGGFGQDDTTGGNFRDDDEGQYADRRA